MALPTTISGVLRGQQNSYHGPFISSGGNVYTILEDSTTAGQIEAWKATDPTTSFSEQDTSNRPSFSSYSESLNVVQDGDDLHVVGQNDVLDIYYARFSMSSDAWANIDGAGDRDILVASISVTGDAAPTACDITVLSTGKIRIVAQGEQDKDMGTGYSRIDEYNSTNSGQSWSSATLAFGAATDTVNYTGPRIVLPPNNSDQAYMACIEQSTPEVIAVRGIASDNTLRTERNVIGDISNNLYGLSHMVGFVKSSQSQFRVMYLDDHTGAIGQFATKVNAYTDDTDFTTSDAAYFVDSNFPNFINNSIVACPAVDGTTIRFLRAQSGNGDLYEGDDAGTDTWTESSTAHLAGTLNHVSCNVYTRSGNIKLAMIYDDGGTIKYDEIDQGAAPAPPLFPPFRRIPNNLLRM